MKAPLAFFFVVAALAVAPGGAIECRVCGTADNFFVCNGTNEVSVICPEDDDTFHYVCHQAEFFITNGTHENKAVMKECTVPTPSSLAEMKMEAIEAMASSDSAATDPFVTVTGCLFEDIDDGNGVTGHLNECLCAEDNCNADCQCQCSGASAIHAAATSSFAAYAILLAAVSVAAKALL